LRTEIVIALIAVTSCALPRTTSAQPYFTAAVGAGRNDVDCTSTPTRTCEKDDVAFKFLGGYRIAPWIAGEVVYLDFGEARRASTQVEDIYGTSAFGGGVGLHGNFASWTLTARVGAARVANKRGAEWLVPNPPPSISVMTPKLMPYGGAAVGYWFSKYVGLAAAFDVTKSKWERSDGASLTWNAFAVTAGLTIGR
jgi:hypothetical protein